MLTLTLNKSKTPTRYYLCSWIVITIYKFVTDFQFVWLTGWYCGYYYNKRRNSFPNKMLCELCKNVIKFHRIKFLYDHIILNEPDPNDIPTFCNKFLKENVALVKVEMATKSMTR